ncbi:hypothetical protein GCM10028807_57850 [Spirosoma daeguense]
MASIKQAAKVVHQAYEAIVPGKDKAVKVSHVVDENGLVKVSLSGKKSLIDSLLEKLQASVSVPAALGPLDGILIHSSALETKDGPHTEKAEDQQKTLTIDHVLTTY